MYYYFQVISVKTGSVFWASLAALSYFYMVLYWTLIICLSVLLVRSLKTLKSFIILGISMGWLCVHYQFNTLTCFFFAVNGKIPKSFVYKLYSFLHTRPFVQYADSICWISTNTNKRTHGSFRYVFLFFILSILCKHSIN